MTHQLSLSINLFRTHALRIAAVGLVVLTPSLLQAQYAGMPAAARVTTSDVAGLRWIAGDWIGAGTEGTVQAPFFERYRFVNDSTLLVETFADSTFAAVKETSRFELRFGRFGNSGRGNRWAAIRIDSLSVDFGPVARTRSTFNWSRPMNSGPTPEQWEASIRYPGAKGQQNDRYRMQRRK